MCLSQATLLMLSWLTARVPQGGRMVWLVEEEKSDARELLPTRDCILTGGVVWEALQELLLLCRQMTVYWYSHYW